MVIEIGLKEIRAVKDLPSLRSFIRQFIQATGYIKHFSYFISHYAEWTALGPQVFWSYPQEMADIYKRKNYFKIDPAIYDATYSLMPFACSHKLYYERLNEKQHEFFSDFSTHETIEALICPIHGLQGETGGMCYVVENVEAFLRGHSSISQWELMGFTLACHEMAKKVLNKNSRYLSQKPKLTPREIDCLTWSAQGKTADEIGMILGLSEKTISTYLKSSFAKLNAANKPHAVAKAIINGSISSNEIQWEKASFIV